MYSFKVFSITFLTLYFVKLGAEWAEASRIGFDWGDWYLLVLGVVFALSLASAVGLTNVTFRLLTQGRSDRW